MLVYAILGLLSRRSLTGYQIKKRFNASVIFFWHSTQSQIYGTLKEMERHRLVTSDVVRQGRTPYQRVYSLADAGREALLHWLQDKAEMAGIKDEFLLRVFFSDLLSHAETIAHLRHQTEKHEARLALYEARRAELVRRHGPLPETDDDRLFSSHLTLSQGIMRERMYIDWCRWAIGQLEGRPRRGEGRRSPRVTAPPDHAPPTTELSL